MHGQKTRAGLASPAILFQSKKGAVALVDNLVVAWRMPGICAPCDGRRIDPGGNLLADLRIGKQARRCCDFRNVPGTPVHSFQPTLQVRAGGQGVGLAPVTQRMGQHEVVRQVARVLRERNEMVDLSLGQGLCAVKAIAPVHLAKPLAHGLQRLPGR